METTIERYRITRGGHEVATLGYGEAQQHSLQTAARHWCLAIGGHLAGFRRDGLFVCAYANGTQKGYMVTEVQK